MLGAAQLGAYQLGQAFSGGSVAVPDDALFFLDLVASFSGPLDLVGSHSGAVSGHGTWSGQVALVGTDSGPLSGSGSWSEELDLSGTVD